MMRVASAFGVLFILAAVSQAAAAAPQSFDSVLRQGLSSGQWQARYVQHGGGDEPTGIASATDVAPDEPEGEEEFNPADPTNIATQLNMYFEWTKLADGGGDLFSVLLDVWTPLSPRDLLSTELRLTTASLSGLDSETGPGDTRLRYFHLVPSQGAISTWAPSLDLIIPTGDQLKGTGGGSWLIMPNVVLVQNISDTWSGYYFIRYVHSLDDALPALIGGITPPPAEDASGETKIRGLNVELLFNAAIPPWTYTVKPNFFRNFASGGGTSLATKLDAGPITGGSFPNLEVNLPVSGDNTFDSEWKLGFAHFF